MTMKSGEQRCDGEASARFGKDAKRGASSFLRRLRRIATTPLKIEKPRRTPFRTALLLVPVNFVLGTMFCACLCSIGDWKGDFIIWVQILLILRIGYLRLRKRLTMRDVVCYEIVFVSLIVVMDVWMTDFLGSEALNVWLDSFRRAHPDFEEFSRTLRNPLSALLR